MKEGEFMTGKEYLSAVQDKDKDIVAQEEYIESLRSVLESISVKLSDDRVQSTSDPDKFGKIFAQIDEEEKKLEKMKSDFLMYKVGAITAIKNVETEKHRRLLYERYIHYKPFKTISVLMGYSYDYVLELHGNSLIEFEEMNPVLFC